MKQIITFSILFCLVFLNVPRSLVHDCDHTTIEHSDHNNDDGLSMESANDVCFLCEFDLGLFSLPGFRTPAFAKFYNYTFITPSVDYHNPEEFKAFSHRGPPTV